MSALPDTSIVPNNIFSELSIPDHVFTILEENIRIGLSSLSDKNLREYHATFSLWTEFAISKGVATYNFQLPLIQEFLTDNNWSFNTRKVRLAHIRKYAEIIALSDSENNFGWAHNFGRMALLKPKGLGGKKNVIKGRSLSRREVYKVFDTWSSDSIKDTRNSAILGLMLLSGLRASEVVAIQWEHIDYSENTIYVLDGKGGKSSHIPMLGDLKHILLMWQGVQSESGNYSYVCSQIFRSGKLAPDKKCTTRIISTIVSATCDLTGFLFNPHDTRRTAITALLNRGASVAETRDFARHKSGETTLIYAQKSSAKKLGSTLDGKLGYEDVLGARKHTLTGREWECGEGHGFNADEPTECPICGNTNLSHQISMFDD